jgi:DNA-binding transcriptional MerR regulator
VRAGLVHPVDRASTQVLRARARQGIAFLPDIPLGWPRESAVILDNPTVLPLAERYDAARIALAWLARWFDNVMLILGPASRQHLVESIAVGGIELDDDASFPSQLWLRAIAYRRARRWGGRGTVETMASEGTNGSTAREVATAVMTIGVLARRSGVSVKTLRDYEDLGFIYTVGRSAGNYRLFGEEALWCVAVIGTLRELGLTLTEIRELTSIYLGRSAEPIGPRLARTLRAVRARTEARIEELKVLLCRITEYETAHPEELSGRADFREHDPRFGKKGP